MSVAKNIGIAILLGGGILFGATLLAQEKNSCRTCHLEAGAELAAPVQAMDQNDVHASRGLSCASCHGGDPTSDEADVAMSRAKGFLGVPKPPEIPQFCARCHAQPEYLRRFSVSLPTDQFEKYWTSKHGQALKTGDTKVATCVSCHGVHTILPANNPQSSVWPLNVPATCKSCHAQAELMAQYGLSANTYQDYVEGVHGQALLERKDIGAPACNDCHGNHGATPPGVEAIAQVCRQCHAGNAELFIASPHKEVFDAADLPECVTCHRNHRIVLPTDDWLGVQGDNTCGQCHAPGETGYQTALTLKTWIDSLRTVNEQAAVLVSQAEHRGVEVSEAQFELKEAQEALLKARTAIHTFNADKVREAVQAGLNPAEKALHRGQEGLAAFAFRRRGLGIATIFITLLIVALWLKLRQMEKRKNESG